MRKQGCVIENCKNPPGRKTRYASGIANSGFPTSIKLMNATAKSKRPLAKGNAKALPTKYGIVYWITSPSDPSASLALATKVGAPQTSIVGATPHILAPRATNRRVFAPSPQPISKPSNPATSGNICKKAGVFNRSRYTSYPARTNCVHVAAFRSQYSPTLRSSIRRFVPSKAERS